MIIAWADLRKCAPVKKQALARLALRMLMPVILLYRTSVICANCPVCFYAVTFFAGYCVVDFAESLMKVTAK